MAAEPSPFRWRHWTLTLTAGVFFLRTGCCWQSSSFAQCRRFARKDKKSRHDQRGGLWCPSSLSLRVLSVDANDHDPHIVSVPPESFAAPNDLPVADVLDYETLEPGTLPGHKIVKEYSLATFQSRGFADAVHELLTSGKISDDDCRRLHLTATNVTVPVALMILDPITYPSLSRARKACRKRSIIVVHDNCRSVGLVGDRVVVPDDGAVQVQQRFGTGYFAAGPYDNVHKHDEATGTSPPLLQVLYEDDHVAIINKPAGLLVHRAPQSSPSCPTTRTILPKCLVPPVRGTLGALNRPVPVHRLDKPTSGCLVVAKTKPALVTLGRSFHDRTVHKTYTALVSGKLPAPVDNPNAWSVIDEPLDGKEAITYWRVISESPCEFALDQTLSLVEMQPKTGRFHQLRRHMALVLQKPLVGDDDYDGNSPNAKRLRHRGLCLCATSITIPHPWYNTPQGRNEYRRRISSAGETTIRNEPPSRDDGTNDAGCLWFDDGAVADGGGADGTVMITAHLGVPAKFHALIAHERDRFLKFHTTIEPDTVAN